MEITETEMDQMIALSIIDGDADNSEVLVEEDNDWNIWGEAEDED